MSLILQKRNSNSLKDGVGVVKTPNICWCAKFFAYTTLCNLQTNPVE